MKKTRICELLNIDYPIIQGGMLWVASAELAAAVSNAGGFGVISPLAGMGAEDEPSENLLKLVTKVKSLTNRPFGVNIPLDLSYAGLLIDLAIGAGIRVVITAAGNPADYTALLKAHGIIVLHVVSNVKQAKKAEKSGVDGVIAEGVEAAAHNGPDEIPLFSLIPQVVDAVSVPVVAAGGIADARGVAAALCLGAEGAQLGTRFVAVEECVAHINYKQAIVNAGDTDTVLTGRRIVPTRCLKTEFSDRMTALEKAGADDKELLNLLGYRRNRISQIGGDLSEGEAYAGASSGLVKKILPAKEVIEQLVKGCSEVLAALNA